jgi:hypothetical protein
LFKVWVDRFQKNLRESKKILDWHVKLVSKIFWSSPENCWSLFKFFFVQLKPNLTSTSKIYFDYLTHLPTTLLKQMTIAIQQQNCYQLEDYDFAAGDTFTCPCNVGETFVGRTTYTIAIVPHHKLSFETTCGRKSSSLIKICSLYDKHGNKKQPKEPQPHRAMMDYRVKKGDTVVFAEDSGWVVADQKYKLVEVNNETLAFKT